MRGLAIVAGGFVWAILVFVGTFFLTFPSQVVADRVRYEIPNVLGKDYSGEIGSVGPWWVGLSADDIKIYKEPDRGEADEDIPQLVALFSNVRLRLKPLASLMRRSPYVKGSVMLTEGRLDYSVGTAVNQRGDIQLADLVLGAQAMPLGDLFLLVPGLTATGEGAIDLDVDLHAGEDGMRDATGRISIGGTGLSLSDIELPTVGALGIQVPISELALAADVADGVATISTGKLESEIATIQITGNLTLRDPIDRSAVDVQIVLSNLGDVLAPYTGFMGDAKQPDGTFHYSCRGVISRLGPNSCTVGERRVSSSRTPGAVGPSSPMARTPSPPGTPRDAESDEERERRRDEIRERLRQKREERDAERTAAATSPSGEDPIEGDEEPEQRVDEEDEEPPPQPDGDVEPDLDEPPE